MSGSDENGRRRITLRRVRRGAEEARADAEFWLSMTPEQRVELLWEMALESLGRPKTEGLVDDQPRLSRVVRCVRRT